MLVFATFKSIALLFTIGIVGFLIVKRKVLPGNILDMLSPLVLDIALPALIFVKILNQLTMENFKEGLLIPLAWLAFIIFSFTLTFIFKYLVKENRNEFSVSLFYQNSMFIPIVVLTTIYGNDTHYLLDLFLFTMLYPPFTFNTYHRFFHKKSEKIRWDRIFHPVVIAIIIAILVSLTGLKHIIPSFIVGGLNMIGQITIPLMMIIIGGNIYMDYKEMGNFQPIPVIKFVVVKNFIFPLLALVLLYFLKPSFNIGLIIVLQSAAPPLTALPLFASRYGGKRKIINQYIVFSFIISIISIPLMLHLFSFIYK